MKFTGERVVFDQMKGNAGDFAVLALHWKRYFMAFPHVYRKSVLDAGCGTGYGSWLLSLGAKYLIMVDKDEESVRYSEKLPFACPILRLVADLNTEIVPSVDVCVCFEVLEHLNPGNEFLKNLRADELFFCVPIDHPSEFHHSVWSTEQAALAYVCESGWEIVKSIQDGPYPKADAYISGHAKRR